ncbi:KEOPS complex subunit Pcc1 [Halomarina ordinaria]|uniref:KEOPS complex subunit Pcc1 n=1 Tax=Halomarina ordinaria TaxID=3033939 RepID=A0ABD5UAD0_9EURY|nr:KEOPS complex subunit Pcc1 [Halomarina sp. PSRA2]
MKRATVRTRVEDAALVAAALDPDNTPEMHTTVDGDAVVTVVERETTGGLRSTVDDYVTNLTVASQLTDTDTNHE